MSNYLIQCIIGSVNMEKFKSKVSNIFQKFYKIKAISYLTNSNDHWVKALLFFVSYFIISFFISPKKASIDYIKEATENKSQIEFKLNDYSGSFKLYNMYIDGERFNYKVFMEDVQSDNKILKELNIYLPKEEMNYFEKLKFMYFINILLYIGFFYSFLAMKDFFLRMSRNDMLLDKEKSLIKFTDVQGISHIRKDLEEVVEHFLNSEKVKSFGGKTLTGVIMDGPPGTGKTLMAKAVAGEAKANFIAVSGSQFVELYVGVGAKRVREIFEKARKSAPCVIFIDEIDAFALKRGSNRSHSEYDQTVNEMLAQMDGFKDNTGILVIAATNRLDMIDDALLRPGRFSRKIKVDKPSVEGRKEILNLYIGKSNKMSKDLNVDLLAKSTINFSGADLKNLVDEAIYLAIKEDSEKISMIHFMKAKDKIIMGSERDIKLSDSDKKVTAYHEIGHAYISYSKKVGNVSQVSIIPRGEALGVTQMVEDEVHSYSKENLENRLMMLMGGKVAEKIFCNHQSTGASQDLKQATSIATRMVCEWGMSDIGPVNFSYGSEQYGQLSEQMKFMVDQEVRRICQKAETDATELLNKNKEKVEKLVNLLLEKEVILNEEFVKACA